MEIHVKNMLELRSIIRAKVVLKLLSIEFIDINKGVIDLCMDLSK